MDNYYKFLLVFSLILLLILLVSLIIKLKGDAKKAKEDARIAAEDARIAEEDARIAAEDVMRAKEDARKAEEDARIAEEAARRAEEDARRAEEDAIQNYSNKEYKKVMDVTNLAQLKEYFLWDNPRENGDDPTGGMVDYGYGMETDANGDIIKNINGDISWGEIKDNATSKELISEESGLIKINLAKNLMKNKNNQVVVGAPRLISRQLFRGGIFVFDVQHIPVGCGVWPALWLNGFIAAPDQYHQNDTYPTYKDDMQKLANTTIGTSESYSHICKDNDGLDGRKDPHLSKFAGRDIYPMEWPGGGEVDIIEQVNFSSSNKISMHGGPNCEVIFGSPDRKLRSICRAKVCKSSEMDVVINREKNRPSCPKRTENSSIDIENGFGQPFNDNKGGVYVTHWIPKEKIRVWFYPRELFSEEYLKRSGGPLSDNPDPNIWGIGNIEKLSVSKYRTTLIATYILNDSNAIVDGCDINFQGIIINITLGGGWGGNMPNYCYSKINKNDWKTHIPNCYNVDPNNVDSEGYNPETGCYDGAKNAKFRGINRNSVFYTEAYFLIRSIKVFQNDQINQKVW